MALESARSCLQLLVDTLHGLRDRIDRLDDEIATRAKRDEGARRLMSIPGIGPIIATAIQALAPPEETFRSGRDFAAWVGLSPVQKSTGGKTRLGRTSRMGERTLRRRLPCPSHLPPAARCTSEELVSGGAPRRRKACDRKNVLRHPRVVSGF